MTTLKPAPPRPSLPFRSKLTLLTALAVSVALLLSCLGLIGLQYSADRLSAERRHEQIARVISNNIGAAILFTDRQAAGENLSSVAGIDDILWVRAHTATGRVFATYVTPAGSSPGKSRGAEEVAFPIIVQGEQVGQLHMGVHYRTLSEIVRDTAAAAVLIFCICLMMALLIARWLNAMAFRPLHRLVEAMRTISISGDYTLRVDSDPDPDFNTIVSSFNTMLGEVEQRSTALSDTAEELGLARDEAEKANVAKSQFLANMSHELRTPLNAIIGYTEVLQEELAAADMRRSVEDVQWIYSSARQLLGLINGILDLSKIEAGRMDVEVHEFDVTTLVREVGAMLEPISAQHGNTLHLQLDPSLGSANTDSTKLRQCLLNLGSNACKFTEGGMVFILARREEDELVFTVSDTGIGMSREELDRLFQPFVQADASTTRRYGGTGLGLTITWRFAEMLAGSVSVESSRGEGSTFTLRVEADLARARQTASTDDQSSELLQERTERIGDRPLALIVDDEPSAVQLLARMADQAGYDFVSASDGDRCLAMARQLRPDLILLDIGMPRLNGWQVLEALEQDRDLAGIPTVVVTVDDDRRRALAAGASDHLLKPVNRSELTDILNQYARKRSGHVLMVEDDEATARLYERGLNQMGFSTTMMRNGRDALARLQAEPHDFVVTDLRMPHGDGFELIDGIGRLDSTHKPHVIVVTGKVLDAEETQQLSGKIVKLLPKNGLSPRKLAGNLACVGTRPDPDSKIAGQAA